MQRSYRTPKGTELPLLNLRGREYLEVKYRLVWFREDHPDWAIETELLSVTQDSAYGRATIKDEHGRTIATSHKFETRKGFPDFIEKAETGAIGRALALIGYGTQFCADELDEGERIVDAPVESRPPQRDSRPQQRESRPDRETRGPAAAGPANAGAVNAGASKSAPPASALGLADDPFAGAPFDEPARGGPARETVEANVAPASMPKDPGDYQISFGKKYKGVKLRDIPRAELEGYIEWLEDNASKKGLPLSEEARFLKVAVGRYLGAGQPANAGAAPAPSKGASAAGKPGDKQRTFEGSRH